MSKLMQDVIRTSTECLKTHLPQRNDSKFSRELVIKAIRNIREARKRISDDFVKSQAPSDLSRNFADFNNS